MRMIEKQKIEEKLMTFKLYATEDDTHDLIDIRSQRTMKPPTDLQSYKDKQSTSAINHVDENE
jgi:hypothetical protein